MSAPSNTVWGSVINSKGRIGISNTVSSTNTQTTVHVEVWFWSKWGVSDTNNDYYYDNNATNATTNRGSRSIHHTVSSGSGWSTSNQTLLAETDYTYNRGTSKVTRNNAAKFTGIEAVGGTMTARASYTIPVLASYTVKYNANGGSGAPSSQTKYYGKTLKLSSTKPTRTGYTFQGWGTSASDTSVNYAAGANYTSNSAVTLYAIWKANTYAVKYNANGGSVAPGNQTKTYGVNLTLSSTKPTRTNYNFLGWGTSAASTTVAYAAGATYSANAAITLYAIWELAYIAPRITHVSVDRCISSGELSDEGTYAKVTFDWETDKEVSSCYVEWKTASVDGSIDRYTVNATGTTGKVSAVVGSGNIDTEYQWNFTIYVADSVGSNIYSAVVPPMVFLLDCLAGGKGLAIGKPASREGLDIAFDTMFDVNKEIKCGDATFLKFQSSGRPTIANNIGLANAIWLQGQLASGSFINILRMNADGQVELNWTSGGLKGMVFKKLWSGTLSVGGKVTIAEAPYYNLFLFTNTGGDTSSLVARSEPGSTSLRGTGSYPTGSNNINSYAIDAELSGTTMTLENAYYLQHKAGSDHNAGEKLTIDGIYGII